MIISSIEKNGTDRDIQFVSVGVWVEEDKCMGESCGLCWLNIKYKIGK